MAFRVCPSSFKVSRCKVQAVCWLMLPVALIVGCGGSSGGTANGGSGGTPTSADYSLSVQPTSVTINPGSSQTITISVQAQNGFTGSVSISISGLSAGVTASPSSFTIQPSNSQAVTFAATASAATVSGASVTIQGSSGSLSHQAQLALTVKPLVAVASRTKYIRTDSTTPFSSYPPPNWTLYHSPTQRFFASDPYTNHLNVIDSVTQKQIATLVVPGAFGLDQAPDGSVLYVGTMVGDLYVIDPVKLSIIKRYPANTISPYGFEANAVFALANGKLLLEKYFLVPGYSWVDGNGPLAMWNPSDNSIVKFVDPQNLDGLMPEEPSCLAGFEYGILTNNRSRILLTPILTSEGSAILCSFDPVADTWVWSATLSDQSGSALSSLAVSPDGNTVVASTGTTAYVLDAATLQLKTSFATQSTQSLFNYSGIVIGPDNRTLYVTNGTSFIYAYDISTGALNGWLPNVQLTGIDSPETSYIQSISVNGLLAGVMEQGLALLDINALNPAPVGTPFGPGLLSPTFGPVNGGTTTSWSQSNVGLQSSLQLNSAYFGSNLATGLSMTKTGNPIISATSPSGIPGPVDVVTFTSDGGEQILPDAFSYGPWVLEAPTAYATADGGGPAQVYGYGFGPVTLSNAAQPIVAPPVDLQIQVGGGNAKITGYLPEAYLSDGSTFLSSPLPLVGAEFTVPTGTAGTSADVIVTNTSGSTTVTQAITYLPAVQSFPLSGSTLMDGVYDAKRDVYYFTDTNQVRVFSRSQSKWLNSIVIPPPVGAYGPQRLLGVTLSLDGSKIVVSDAGAIAIYIIDPDNPTSIKSYPYASQVFGEAITETPSGVAITNSGIVYITTFDLDGDRSPFLLTLDSSTGKVTPYTGAPFPFSTDGPYQYGRLPMSSDGTRIYVNSEGGIAAIDTSSGAITYPFGTNDLGQDGYEIVLAANQTSLFADGFLMDSDLNVRGLLAMNWRERIDADPVYGATMSPDGGLLFQPNSQSIDVFDGNTGAFRSRISLPMTLSSSYRALVSDGKDSVQVAITGTGGGIAVIDLGSLVEPDPIPFFARSLSDRNLDISLQGHARQVPERQRSMLQKRMPQHHVVSLVKAAPFAEK